MAEQWSVQLDEQAATGIPIRDVLIGPAFDVSGELLEGPVDYEVIVPPGSISSYQLSYILHSQDREYFPSETYIPTGYGILVYPGGGHSIFSTEKVKPGSVYDLHPLPWPLEDLKTGDVATCGVSVCSFGGFRLMTHARGPISAGVLMRHGLELAQAHGAAFDNTVSVSLFYNPVQRAEGPVPFIQRLEESGRSVGIPLAIEPVKVQFSSRIRLRRGESRASVHNPSDGG